MRVAVNARLLAGPSLRGWNRYTVNLLAELPALGVELLLYSDRPIHPDHLARLPAGGYQTRLSPAMRYAWWEQRWLPRQCGLDRADLLHCPINFGLAFFNACPQVLTLHDAIDQVYYGPRTTWREALRPANLLMRVSRWIARRRAARIVTVSRHACGDLVARLGVRADRVSIVYEAADPRFQQPVTVDERREARGRHGLSRPYFFYVGGWERRKNVPFLVRAFAEARLTGVDLVLAGGRAEERGPLLELASRLGVADRLRLLGWVEDAQLPALYAEALGFVYPSEYEGFGLQLCEAMAVGCPTLAARATSLPEVLGDGGETFGLEDVGELSGQLRRLAEDPDQRAQLSERARRRGEAFSWRETARQTLAVYAEARGR
jgi:glycosyltransferase involved in cell wall biosynthesis